jgi:DNA repair exonuclease SbcCD nuclease subunit
MLTDHGVRYFFADGATCHLQKGIPVSQNNNQGITFLHTADWQLGKPFATVDDIQKRSLIQQERFNVLHRIAETAREHHAQFIVVAGDLFDSPSATKSTVSAACSAIGAMQIPVIVIPGNHDHGGPGCIWEQSFFTTERDQLAPNLTVLLRPEPVEICGVVLFPCPLLRRHESTDPTTWLRSISDKMDRFENKPRIVLIHGSVHGFDSQGGDDDMGGGQPNIVDLPRLPESEFDYFALGDWHGTKQVGSKAWYAGTPENDRFPRGDANDPGHVLIVNAQRESIPNVTPIRTARLGWHQLEHSFVDDAGLDRLEHDLGELIGGRAQTDLLRLELRGSLGIEATTRLGQKLEAWNARLLRLKLSNQTVVAPSAEEVNALTQRSSDPLISRVASQLVSQTATEGDAAAIARIALSELHAICHR